MTNRRAARAAAGRPARLVPPERLRRPPVVEDWVTWLEEPPGTWTTDAAGMNAGRTPFDIHTEWMAVAALMRWQRVRVAWAKENGLPWGEFLERWPWTPGPPAWRDPPSED